MYFWIIFKYIKIIRVEKQKTIDYFCCMKISIKLVCTALIISTFFSCNGVKSLTKKGDKATEKKTMKRLQTYTFLL